MAGAWNIDVPASQAVIGSAASSVQGLQEPIGQMQAALMGVSESVPSPVVQAALGALVEAVIVPATQGLVSKSVNVLESTAEAVGHYAAGDLNMAANAARGASAMPAGWAKAAGPQPRPN
ncbi:DUF6507 family protein [Arthrobacter sp. NPDC056691]|uniref:DUF6507 family protein n=1 Tax=unclassified Arthrobacter TaxID=235627 RepID=UPI00366EE2D8